MTLLANTIETAPTFSVIWAAVATAGSVLCGAVALLFRSNEKKGEKIIESLTADKAVLVAEKSSISEALKEERAISSKFGELALKVATEANIHLSQAPIALKELGHEVEKQHTETKRVILHEISGDRPRASGE